MIGDAAGLDRVATLVEGLVVQNRACSRLYFAQFGSRRVPKSAANPTGVKLTDTGKAFAENWLGNKRSRINGHSAKYWNKILSIEAEYLRKRADDYQGANWLKREVLENELTAEVAKSQRNVLRAASSLLTLYRTVPTLSVDAQGTPEPWQGWKMVDCPKMRALVAQLQAVSARKAAETRTLPQLPDVKVPDIESATDNLKWGLIAAAVLFIGLATRK